MGKDKSHFPKPRESESGAQMQEAEMNQGLRDCLGFSRGTQAERPVLAPEKSSLGTTTKA